MSSPSPTDLLVTAEAAARAGAAVLRRYFRSDDLRVDRKAANDFVSQADRESEEAVVAEILRRHPQHRILAEEGGAGGGAADTEWVIDPLDGTTNFLQGLPVFCVSVAVRRGGEMLAGVVLDPLRDDLFAGSRGGGATWNDRPMRVSGRPDLDGAFLATGYPWRAKAALGQYLSIFHDLFLEARSIRRCGAAALDLAYTAAGVYDGFFEFRLSPWDIAAGVLLVREAGGRVTDLDGREGFPRGGNVIAAGEALQPHLLEAVHHHADEATLDRLVPVAEGSEAEPPAELASREAARGAGVRGGGS
jgi:myo-inositol-1(or 4)-monophosphatase